MSLFEKLLNKNKNVQGVAPLPEEMMSTMQPGIAGPGGFDAPMPDPSMLANQPLLQNFREQEQMVGLAHVTLENEQIIEEFANKLRGYRIKYELDPKTASPIKKIERFGKPFCNDDGINELVGDLRMYTSKAFMLSNIPTKDKDRIKKWCLVIAIGMTDKIKVNTSRWSVDTTRRSTVMDIFMSIVEFNMLRSFEDGERTKLYPTQKNINMSSSLPHMMPQQKRSVLDI
jgi:hypothetical protein